MNPKASCEVLYPPPSASRDCSTCQFRYAALSELEFHNKKELTDIVDNTAYCDVTKLIKTIIDTCPIVIPVVDDN
jgi:hypothetical protein